MMMLLKAFGFILLFFALAAVAILVVMFGAEYVTGRELEQNPALTLGLIFGLLAAIVVAFVPYLNFAMRRSFVFEPAAGVVPLDEEVLRDELLAINGLRVPVSVRRKGRKLILGWRYLDAEVWGLLSKQQLRRTYELHVKLDGAKKQAILTDVRKNLRLGAGPDAVRFGFGFVRGYLVEVETGQGWNLNRDLSVDEAYEFKFNPQEIKGPVLDTIVRSGWTARYGMW